MNDPTRQQPDGITYDPARLHAHYPTVRMITHPDASGDPRVPYTVEFLFTEHPEFDEHWGYAELLEKQYRLPPDLSGHRDAMVAAHPSQIAKKDDDQAIAPRVAHFHVGPGSAPFWKIEHATYRDQLATNMYPDAPLSPPVLVQRVGRTASSIREWDQFSAGLETGLPSLDDSRLANTIGVAVGVTAKTKAGNEVILWRRRSNKVRIYQGMPHVPLSFALNLASGYDWHGAPALRDLILADYNAERAEELGVEQHFFGRLRPLAFCRDLARAGKPQFFFEKPSYLTFEELKTRITPNSPEFIGELEMLEVDAVPPAGASPELLAFIALRAARRRS